MVEGDREVNWLSSPSFFMCTDDFPAFLWIYRLSRDVRWVGDSAVGTTSILSVGDSAVGTTSFSANLWSKVGLVENVWLLSLLAKFPSAASKYDFGFCKTVVTKLSATCSVSQFVSTSSFGCWKSLLFESLWMSNFAPLSYSDLLHRSAKLKSSYIASSLLFSQMNVQEAGIDPFLVMHTVEKVS